MKSSNPDQENKTMSKESETLKVTLLKSHNIDGVQHAEGEEIVVSKSSVEFLRARGIIAGGKKPAEPKK